MIAYSATSAYETRIEYYAQFTCCRGYRQVGTSETCEDINECCASTSGCSQKCKNTPGSYHCECYNGYRLFSDSRTCIDIDECAEGTSGCSQICINAKGSYVCLCNSGYQLSSDGKTCIGTCAAGTSGCSQLCSSTDGSYVCLCYSGYQLSSDRKTCIDIDECAAGTSGCSQICRNTIGSYYCLCNSGFQLSSDNKTCIDINECAAGTSGCSQICINTIGSYYCLCNSGYQLSSDSKTCIAPPPAITWNGLSVANNSLVTLSVITNRVSTLGQQPSQFPLVCQGITGGQWYQPNGVLFPLATPDPVSTPGGLGQRNWTKGVELFRGVPAVFPHGVQCCTNTTTTLCVGMYTDPALAGSVNLARGNGASFDLSVAATYGPNITEGVQFQLLTPTNTYPPVFQLTCTSTSSPATRVQWTFNGNLGSNSQIVIDRPTSTYNNILIVTGRLPGMYTCTVTTMCSPVCGANGFTLNPRSASSSFIVGVPPDPPSGVIAVQSGPTAVNISWTAPKSGGPVIRYDIYYIGNRDPGRIGNGSTTSTSWILTNLQFGARYNISIIAVGTYFGSQIASTSFFLLDIDECAVGTSGCSQRCNNTIGSYKCLCYSGYELSSDRKTCIDINECAVGTSGCTQICNNTIGSYVCLCNSGFQLSSDNKTCMDIDECAAGTSGCSQICSNTIGSYVCSCNSGFQLSSDNKTCIDIDECAMGTSGCSQICSNTIGSYVCSCNSGYRLSSDNKTCIALTPPAITWNGLSVANNSLVALSAIPNRVSTLGPQPLKFPLVCQGIKGGQWYQPNGDLFPLATPDPVSTPGGLGQRNGTKGVELFRGVPAVFPHGVQCCTNTITTLCVGMYTDLTLAASSHLTTDSGPSFDLSLAATYGPNITGGVQFQLLTPTNVDPPVFQLICTSTSSPPTRVQWTFNGSPVNGSNTTSSQIVIDRPTSTYNNILTVTGRSPGMYTCTVTTTCSPVCWGNGFTPNPRSANISFILGVPPEPPTGVTAVQSGPTAINISWTAPKSGGPVIRYDIYYIGNVDPVRIGNGSSTTTSWILTNIHFGSEYNISIIAVGTYFGSRITSTSVLVVEAEEFGDCGPRLPLSPRSQSQTFTCTSSDSASINTVLLALRNCTERHN